MLTTATDVITGAMRLLGVLASGEALAAAEGADALQALGELCETLSTERLLSGSRARTVTALVAARASYTIGTGQQIALAWPNLIEAAGVLTSDGREIPIRILTDDEYARYEYKALAGSYPTSIYFDHAYASGVGNVSVFPVTADAGYSLVLYTPCEFSAFADLTTEYDLPKGVTRMLRYRLAVELAPEYDAPADERIERRANDATAAVKRANYREEVLTIDPALTWMHHRTINRKSGDVY